LILALVLPQGQFQRANNFNVPTISTRSIQPNYFSFLIKKKALPSNELDRDKTKNKHYEQTSLRAS